MVKSGTFNTGRGYTSEGQIIDYTALLTKVEGDDFFTGYDAIITFDDHSRQIYGTVECYFLDEPQANEIEKDLLAKYDAGKYK